MSEQVTKRGRLVCGKCGSSDIVAVLTVLDYYDAPDGDEDWPVFDADGEDLDCGLAIELYMERNRRRDGECIESQLVCSACGSGQVAVKAATAEPARAIEA